MGRKRKDSRFPPYCYNDGSRWYYRPYKNGKLGKKIRLCAADAPVSKVWAEYEKRINDNSQTLSWLLGLYLDSAHFNTLSKHSKTKYPAYKGKICSRKLDGGGRFGDVLLSSLNRRVFRHYLDTYPRPVAANRHVQFLRAAWNWALQRYDIPDNPCQGVTLNKEVSRDRYVDDTEYSIVYEIACLSRAKYLPVFMELAVLSRARWAEIAGYKKSDVIEKTGLRLDRAKGSRGEITKWSPRLRAAVDAAKELPLNSRTITPYLIHDKEGRPINQNTFESAWKRLMERAIKGVEVEPGKILKIEKAFTFHDLKAKGVSDHKNHESGHLSERAKAVYIRKLPEIDATN